jgi:hypothetical protein
LKMMQEQLANEFIRRTRKARVNSSCFLPFL